MKEDLMALLNEALTDGVTFIQKLLAISCFHAQADIQCKKLSREKIKLQEKLNAVKGPEKVVKEKLHVAKESKASLEVEGRTPIPTEAAKDPEEDVIDQPVDEATGGEENTANQPMEEAAGEAPTPDENIPVEELFPRGSSMAVVNCVTAGCLINNLRAVICTPKTGSAPTVDEVSGVTKEGKDAMRRNGLKVVKTPIVYVLVVESAENMVIGRDELLND
ncbi:hypothetical protein L484_016154 [Morus notabilis]|uniref:Uncharacterized protein n=1 Tax=Morus notabilis TaxID=981085 RepID=W9QL00_9ROSA|nr:hypothetical protein L484_016154 [Morus notabilis]